MTKSILLFLLAGLTALSTPLFAQDGNETSGESAGLSAEDEEMLEMLGYITVYQSGMKQLGFGEAEADAIARGIRQGLADEQPDPAMQAKSEQFQAFIQKRMAAMQQEQAAMQAAAQAAAMAEFEPIADEWEKKDPMNVVLKTNKGDVTIELMPSVAPLAVANFVGHAENGYYDGLTFHRVIDGFMIQGGDPQGDGTGGESIWGKPFPDEFSEDVRFDETGLLAMANSGPATNGSQFFITTGKPDWLNNKHTIFGKVTNGYDVVEEISKVETGAQDKPVEPVVIESVEVQS